MVGPAILLGAGASIDAGLPDTYRLTEVIYEELRKPANNRQAILFGYIVSKLRARRVLLGGSPFDKVNVEEAYDALLKVLNREQDILSEFVSGWDPIFEFIKPRFDEDSFMKGVIESIQDQSRSNYRGFISINESRLREAARAISTSVNGDGQISNVAATVSQYIDILVSVLSIAPGDSSYIDRIVSFAQASGANVATLNYDVLFEDACRRCGIDYDYGLSGWNARQMTEWRNISIKLFKLHGSINWTGSPENINVSDAPPKPERWKRSNALMIFGGHNSKLTPNGPFLQLRNDFEKFMMKTNRCLIAGYSFSDSHINSILRKWVTTRQQGKLVILDPANIDYGLDVFKDSYDSDTRKKTVEIVHVKKSAANGIDDAIRECNSRFNSKFEIGRGGMLPHILIKRIT